MLDTYIEAPFGQKSISPKINFELINKFLKKNLNLFNTINEHNNDNYAKRLFHYFKEKNNINFLINKHIEIFILYNTNNPSKVIKYLIFRYKFLIAGKDKINLGYPPYLLIEPVSTCNLRCPFCFQTDKTFTKKPFMGTMDFNFFKKIIDEADQIGVGAVTLASRGEPTLHKKLTDMIEYVSCKTNIFELKLNTNATFLSEKLCHTIFNNNITQIVISADHYIKEKFEKLRVNSNFEKIVKNVDMLFNIRKEFYPNSITEIRISGIDNDRKTDRNKFKSFWIKRADHVTMGFPLERWDTYFNETHLKIKDACENFWDRMYIWFDGKVNPCDADYKSYLSYGDCKEYSLIDIWNNELINKYRNIHLKEKRIELNPCDRCGVCFK